jgi:hypothetical protein
MNQIFIERPCVILGFEDYGRVKQGSADTGSISIFEGDNLITAPRAQCVLTVAAGDI